MSGGLVISRRVGEQVIVGDGDLVITLTSIEGNRARLTFTDPNKTFPIVRGEKYPNQTKGK